MNEKPHIEYYSNLWPSHITFIFGLFTFNNVLNDNFLAVRGDRVFSVAIPDVHFHFLEVCFLNLICVIP